MVLGGIEAGMVTPPNRAALIRPAPPSSPRLTNRDRLNSRHECWRLAIFCTGRVVVGRGALRMGCVMAVGGALRMVVSDSWMGAAAPAMPGLSSSSCWIAKLFSKRAVACVKS